MKSAPVALFAPDTCQQQSGTVPDTVSAALLALARSLTFLCAFARRLVAGVRVADAINRRQDDGPLAGLGRIARELAQGLVLRVRVRELQSGLQT